MIPAAPHLQHSMSAADAHPITSRGYKTTHRLLLSFWPNVSNWSHMTVQTHGNVSLVSEKHGKLAQL
ncbi:hypothetical protein XELAEV_18008732mg [Xenopus laevis]|uniref:Uncharacterized protein n=1 Tax=Xenopus laevis TaxID=8355 RepID=A0A974I047_XENLA|nr:hypothetical protein XELAEV_18008732mg [Xenopus laevis]